MIILVAIEDELCGADCPDFQIEYTGVGKINAALKTAEVIRRYSPKQIINYGTAGSLNQNLSGLVEVTKFFQRDMDASPLGLKVGETPFEDCFEINLGEGGYSCGTGDSFVTDLPELKTDLVDMEAFAIAKTCFLNNIEFKCFKYVSDHADEGASNDWKQNVAKGKQLFINRLKEGF